MDENLAAAPVFEVEGELVRLLGSRCRDCGAVAFPRRTVCLQCGGPVADERLSGGGRVHSWTVIENPPQGFDESLIYLCVDLDEGPRLFGPGVPPRPSIGDVVHAVPGQVRNGRQGFGFEVRDA